MEESANYSEISKENLDIREHGNSNAREYSRVVETFTKVLEYKEKFRVSLEAKLNFIGKQVNTNVDNLETLLRNIDIYDQNIDKISTNLGNLYAEENSIKSQYEELLNGSSQENNPLEPSNKSNTDDPEGSRETLIQRRKNYLDNLDKSFKRLDSELFSIDKLRGELTNARGEILVKKDEAQKKIRLLEEEGKRFLDEVKRIESELATSVKEEGVLIKEFKEIVGEIESNLEISGELDAILFACLTAAESRNLSQENPVSLQE
tara:strand:+ start:57 stop:845 length:789 start_codon:yes stop_codon:yes gene_type:complete